MAGRTVDQGVSLLTAAEIRVAVLPVGPVPRDIMDEYLELINRYHHVSLSATRSFYRESPLAQQAAGGAGGAGGKTPFQFMDWSNSYMHLRFLQAEDARRRTRLADLHPGRQVLAILGVVYCPMCPSVQQAYEEFKKICRTYPEAFVARCFVFEPSEDHIRQERDCRQLSDLVMFPPGGPSHLEQHLEVWMHDLAAALLTEFENWMLSSTPALMKLNGYADSSEFTGASPVLDEMQKRLAAVDGEMREKQRWGRLMKMKGDMCLLSGSPRDAAEHYRTGHEIAKACSDWVWYGASLEGIATARLHEVINGVTGVGPSDGGGGGVGASAPSSTRGRQSAARSRDCSRANGHGFMTTTKWDLVRRSDVESLVRECLTEARAAYKKRGGAAACQIEQHLKLCRLVSGLRGAAARREVTELVAAVSELLPALPAAEDRIVVTVECAQVVGMVGCHRKRTLLLWHAMEQARAVGAVDKGDLLRIAVRALEPPDDPQAQDPDDLPRTHWSLSRALSRPVGEGSCGWEAVNTVVLEAALAAAKQAHAPAEAWEAAATLLRDHHTVLSPQYQAALLETLSQASAALSTRQRTRPGLGPGPRVQFKRLLPAALPLQPTPLVLTAAGTIAASGAGTGRGKSASSGPFIFNPYAAKRQAKIEAGEAQGTPDWACNDEGRVEVHLVNLLLVPLKIDQLQLHVKYLGPPGTPPPSATTTGGAGGGGGSSLALGSSGRQQVAVPTTGHSSGAATPAHASGGGGGGGGGGAAAAATAAAAAAVASGKAFKTPALNMLLPANGRPHRVILCGKPQLAGTYSIEGCLVTSWGVTWHVPFTTPVKKTAAGGGRSAPLSTAGAAPAPPSSAAAGSGSGGSKPQHGTTGLGRNVCINVLPPLPLVKAVVRASPCGPAGSSPSGPSTPAGAAPQQPKQPQQPVHGPQPSGPHPHHPPGLNDPTVVAVSPRDDDIHASSALTAFAEDLQRNPPVAVFEGQRLPWSLSLQNIGSLPVTAINVVVTNHKGVALKPLRGAPLSASFQGVHLEVDDMALQPATAPAEALPISPADCAAAPPAPWASSGGGAGNASGGALPLRPGGALVLPLMLAVGQAPRGTFREVSLEVTISYLSKPTDRTDADDGSPLLGRRMTLTLTFEVQPSLAVASTFFLDHFAPLYNARRPFELDRPIDLRAAAAGTWLGGPGGGSGGGAAPGAVGDSGGGGDDSDSGADGLASRIGSHATNLSFGPMHRGFLGSVTAASRSSLAASGFAMGGPMSGGSLGMQHLGSLSARLAGLDLSLGGGGRSSRAAAAMSPLHSGLTAPLSPNDLGDTSSAPWLVTDPRDGSSQTLGAPFSIITTSQAHPPGGGRSMTFGRSAVLTIEGPDDALGIVTDSVLCVTVRNTSSYYFRAWLAPLDEALGPPPLTAAAAAAADCPVEVLTPGDTARLACVLPSAALAALDKMCEEVTGASAPAVGAGTSDASTSRTSGQAAGLPLSSAAHRASILAGPSSSLCRMSLTVQLPSGGGGDAPDAVVSPDGTVRPSGSTGGGAGSGAGAGSSGGGGGGSGGGGVELAEEADRMTAAETLAEGWAVAWELVTGLSEAAAGRAPPRGMVRLAAVDVARSLSTSAVHSLRPSTIHFQFQVLPPALTGHSTVPRLKDLSHRLLALGLVPAHVAGSVWGLRAQLGDVFRFELLIHNHGSHAHRLVFSLAATAPSFSPPDAVLPHHSPHPHHNPGMPLQPYGTIHAASFQTVTSAGQAVPLGAPYPRQQQLAHYRQPHTFDGYTSGGSLTLGGVPPPSAHSRGGGGAASSELYGAGVSWTSAMPAPAPGIDPGVVLMGAAQNVHVEVGARGTARHTFALTFANPGFYQLFVHEVSVVPEGADAVLWSGWPGQSPQPQRIYASVDRFNVLCV